MIELGIFALASLVFTAVAATITTATIALKRRRRQRLFPVKLNLGVRCNHIPPKFTQQEIENQLFDLWKSWDQSDWFDLSGLNIVWTPSDVDKVEATYRAGTATVPCGGAEHVWRTALAVDGRTPRSAAIYSASRTSV